MAAAIAIRDIVRAHAIMAKLRIIIIIWRHSYAESASGLIADSHELEQLSALWVVRKTKWLMIADRRFTALPPYVLSCLGLYSISRYKTYFVFLAYFICLFVLGFKYILQSECLMGGSRSNATNNCWLLIQLHLRIVSTFFLNIVVSSQNKVCIISPLKKEMYLGL